VGGRYLLARGQFRDRGWLAGVRHVLPKEGTDKRIGDRAPVVWRLSIVPAESFTALRPLRSTTRTGTWIVNVGQAVGSCPGPPTPGLDF